MQLKLMYFDEIGLHVIKFSMFYILIKSNYTNFTFPPLCLSGLNQRCELWQVKGMGGILYIIIFHLVQLIFNQQIPQSTNFTYCVLNKHVIQCNKNGITRSRVYA